MPPSTIAVVENFGFLYWQLANGRQVAIYDNLRYWRSRIGPVVNSDFQALEPGDAEFISMLEKGK